MRKVIGVAVAVMIFGAGSAMGAYSWASSGPSTGNPCKPKGTNHDDYLVGTSGDDHICGGNGKDTIIGLGGDDRLAGNHDSDTINAGTGDDYVIPGKGVDTVNCGGGWDTVQVNFRPAGETYTNCEVFFDPAPH